MAITDWPQQERPREKLLAQGTQSLSDAELLAIFLQTGIKGKTAVDIARDSLNTFGNLRALLDAEQPQFCQNKGLGTAKYVLLKASLELSQRYLQQKLEHENVIQNPEDTKRYLTAKLRKHHHEVFACLFLNSKHRIIGFEELFPGTIDSSTVHPRIIVKRALANNAAAIILAHNHPSGQTTPSKADITTTQKISQALALIDVKVLDHIIIGEDEAASFAELGLM